MSHSVGVHEFLQRARQHRHFLETKLGEARKLGAQAGSYGNEVEQGLAAARVEAAATYLPGFDPVSLATAERLLHLPAGWAQERVRLVEVEDRKLEKRIQEIEGDDRYQFRSSYLGENGEWTGELAAAKKAHETSQGHAARFEHLPRFRELITSKFGTPEYRAGCLSFLDPNPRAADEAVKALGKTSWDEVRQDYEVAHQTVVAKKKKVLEVSERIAGLETLVKERDAAIARRAALKGEAPLLDSRNAVADHLGRADRRALAITAKAAGRTDCLAALARLDGLDSQASYLRSMNRDQSEVQAIEQEIAGLDRDIAKYSRPKKAGERIPYDKFQKRFVDRPARLQKRLERRQKMMSRIYDYDDWDPAYDWDDDVPWWFYMVGRNDPGYGFDDVSTFTRRHPHYVFARPAPLVDPLDDDDDRDDDGRDDDDDRRQDPRTLMDNAAAAAALAANAPDRDVS